MLFFLTKTQSQIPFPAIGYTQQSALALYNVRNDSNHLNRKWFISAYSGMAAGVGFFNAGNVSFFTAQTGLQLNRRLNNNLYAFAGVTATPVYFNFNRSFGHADPYKNYMTGSGFGANGYGIYPGIQAGLMYVNDEKTFSISGSFEISNSGYPVYQANKASTQKQSFAGTRQ